MVDCFCQFVVVVKIKIDYLCICVGEVVGDGLFDVVVGVGDEGDVILQVKQVLCKVFIDYNVYFF